MWETKIGEHEALTKNPFDIEVKSTHLYQATTGALGIHLDLQHNIVTNYALPVEQITTF